MRLAVISQELDDRHSTTGKSVFGKILKADTANSSELYVRRIAEAIRTPSWRGSKKQSVMGARAPFSRAVRTA
jgi:hypothetical protein